MVNNPVVGEAGKVGVDSFCLIDLEGVFVVSADKISAVFKITAFAPACKLKILRVFCFDLDLFGTCKKLFLDRHACRVVFIFNSE